MVALDAQVQHYFDPDGKSITMLEWDVLFGSRTKSDDSWWRKRTDVGDAHVSTVWLGLNDRVWKTTIFRDADIEDRWRYSSKEAALRHHDAVVAALQAGEKPPGLR